MTKFKIICLLLPLIFLVSCSDAKQITGPQVTAVEYIEKFGIGSNLSSISHKAIKVTKTYQIIVSTKGESKANKIITAELKESISKHQKQWDSNLAKAYLEFLTINEINSLYYNGTSSPHSKKQRQLQSKIGASMQGKSKKLLLTVITETLEKSFKSMQSKT